MEDDKIISIEPKLIKVPGIQKILEQNSISIKEPKRKLSKNEQINENDLETILSEDDFKFYRDKKEEYLVYYPDLTDPFDLDDLHLMIMEQIIQRNLLKKKRKTPAIDITKDYESSVKRQLEFKKSLSVRRMDRVKIKDQKKQVVNIASLSVGFSDKEKMKEFADRLRNFEREEQDLDASKIVE